MSTDSSVNKQESPRLNPVATLDTPAWPSPKNSSGYAASGFHFCPRNLFCLALSPGQC